MKHRLLFSTLTVLISVGIFGQSQPRQQPSAQSDCAEALDLLYRLGKVRSHDKPTAAQINLNVSWPLGDPEARDVPRRALNRPEVCGRIHVLVINMTRTNYGKKAPPRRANLAPLLQFRELRVLYVYGRAFTDSDRAPIARMKKLDELRLLDSSVDDRGLRILRGLTGLRTLHIERTRVRGAGLVHIAGLTRLESLDISHNPMGDEAMRHAGKLRNLSRLNISYTRIGNRAALHFAKLRELTYLNMRHTRLKGKGLRYIGGLPELYTIDIFGTPIGQAGFKYLARLPSLHRIYLNGGQITNGSLRALTRSRNWKQLNIHHTSWDPYGHRRGILSYALKGYGGDGGSNYLNLRPTRTTGKVLPYLRGINLTSLELSTRMTNNAVRIAARHLKKVKKLYLSENISRNALWHVVHMPRLKRLDIGCSKVVQRDLVIVHRKRPEVKYWKRRCGRERFAWEPIRRRN